MSKYQTYSNSLGAKVKEIRVIIETSDGKDMILTATGPRNHLSIEAQYENMDGYWGLEHSYLPGVGHVTLNADLFPDEEGNCFTMEIVEMNVYGREDRFPSEGGDPIYASVPGYDKIPVESENVTFIGLGEVLTYAKTLEEKRLMAFEDYQSILIAWPGKYSQDIFIVDDLDALRRRLGFSLKEDKIKVDGEGRKWRLDECK